VAYRKRLGYVPEEASLYPYLTGQEYLDMVATLRAMPDPRKSARINSLLELFSLWPLDKFLTCVVAGIEPTPQRHWRSAQAFVKFGNGPIRSIEAVVRDRQNCGQYLVFILIPDLDDVAVGRGVGKLEHVGSRR